ncbi:HAD family hydrolase [Primorskyibacter sp. 2E107]|uniref:HAD family hydrolase n=1 Tax=Primorskyibacter sp. 2E107 TaxID=3403458 RepID=UPI003AF523C7
MKQVVFDIGNVLVDWQPHLAWPEMDRAEAEAFLTRIDFADRNLRADHGARFADLAAELNDPDDSARLNQYVTRYALTVADAVPGSWALVDRLIAKGVALHAITNWSSETWPEGLKAHPRLGEIFETLVVSGDVKLIKPDPAIYRLFCDLAGLAPQDCVFIDDKDANCDGARSIGMDAIHFTGAAALETALTERGLL